MTKKSDSDLHSVLQNDGVPRLELKKYENITSINLEELRQEMGPGSWAARIAYNHRYGGVVIQQHPGEGNRTHYHTDTDENWIILDGEWEWWIDGEGTTQVKQNDIIVVKAGVWHRITCIGDAPGARYAITKPDVDHIYED